MLWKVIENNCSLLLQHVRSWNQPWQLSKERVGEECFRQREWGNCSWAGAEKKKIYRLEERKMI
jgi:hypothetical protein